MITDYLVSLHGELHMPRRRRARVIAEVEDHLLCAAAELRAEGLELAEAEARAVEGFGDPGELGRALTAVDARRHTVRAGWLAAPLSLVAGWLGLRGVVGLGAPLPIALMGFALAQVALVAGGLSAWRSWLVRRGGDPALLVLVRRGSGLVAGCLLAVGAGAALTAARHGTELTILAVTIAAGGVGLCVALVRTLRRGAAGRDPIRLRPDHDVLAELVPVLGEETVGRLERWVGPARRPWRFAAVASAGAGLALAAAHGLAEGGPPDLAHLPRALLAGLILGGTETLCALAGFLVLGRWLGIRPERG